MRGSPRLVLAVVAGLLLSLAFPVGAHADPAGDEGNPSLQAKLATATRAWNDAKGRLATAQARQAQLTTQIQATATKLDEVQAQVTAIVVEAYKGGRIGGLTALLDSRSADQLLDRATMLQTQAREDNRALATLRDTRATYDRQRADLAAEIATAQRQVAVLAAQKKAAEDALAASGGGGSAAGPSGGSASATPAPRNADGSWPPESCSVDDPTTSGCITPRMLHAYQQVRAAGFTHYTSCHRNGGSGEHPEGRACDFSAHATGFVDARATGADKAYGDRLAAWLLANSDRLGVLYVIWYKRIWLPSSGWRSYTGDGTPAGDHYNHVHLSVQ